MCHRPATKHYAVYVDAKHLDILSQGHGTIDTQTFAQLIFGNGGYALIHNRCRLLWALAFISAHQPYSLVYRDPYSEISREWDIHQRNYTVARVRWYQQLIAAVDQQRADIVARWPVPQPGRKPTPREAVGYKIHRLLRETFADVSTAEQTAQWYHIPGSPGLTLTLCAYGNIDGIQYDTITPRSLEEIARLLLWVHFVDRDLFTERGIILQL